MTRIYTRKGDDGTTGLWYGGRVPKADVRTEAYGSIDEAGAALGVARSLCGTDAQLAAVKRLVGELRSRHDIDPERIVGHGDVKATACPGRLFPLDEIRAAVQTAALPTSTRFPSRFPKPIPDASPRSPRMLEGIDR